ncbi:MAG TPA: 16S rRNA (guanine(527)-N(7))-methyltransferase RsmG [Xanthobacteraceae bacterium]
MLRRRDTPGPLPGDRARAFELTPVSRETAERLEAFVALLLEWQRTTNLIAPSTIPRLWTRHIADSLQLLDLAPGARAWIDLGSGGGFPGVPIACALTDTPGATIHLVESNTRKAAFLREAARRTAAPLLVHLERIENFAPHFDNPVDVVCARALAPLDNLINLSFPLLGKTGTMGLFPKGRDAGVELREASNRWAMHATMAASRTDSAARIIIARNVERRTGAR